MVGTSAWPYEPLLSIWTLRLDTRESGGVCVCGWVGVCVWVGGWEWGCEMCALLLVTLCYSNLQ